jgi:hypothetical protein
LVIVNFVLCRGFGEEVKTPGTRLGERERERRGQRERRRFVYKYDAVTGRIRASECARRRRTTTAMDDNAAAATAAAADRAASVAAAA